MDVQPVVQAAMLKQDLAVALDECLTQIAASVNQAASGRMISDSEEITRTALHKFSEAAYQAALQRRINAAEAAFSPPVDPKTGKRGKNHGQQKRTVVTVNGAVTLLRRWWSVASVSFAPVDDLVDAQHQTYTVGVREMAAGLNGKHRGYESVAEQLARTAQLEVSAEQLRLLITQDGRDVARRQDSGELLPSFQATGCKIPVDAMADADAPPRSVAGILGQKPITRIYVGVDGVMVPVITEAEKLLRRKKTLEKRRKCGKKCRPLPRLAKGAKGPYREFKVVEFHDEGREHTHQTLSADLRNSVGIRIRRDALRLNFLKADERISIVDGATWIQTQLEESAAQLKLDGLGLDFYHFAENIHKCRRRVFGPEVEAGTVWADELGDCFLEQGFEAGFEKLLAWQNTLTRGKKKLATRLINYISDRRHMLNFPEFRKWGWQIGSGPTEARCKTTTYRLKAPGCRWNIANARAIAALTTLKDSGQWQQYWQLHTQLAG